MVLNLWTPKMAYTISILYNYSKANGMVIGRSMHHVEIFALES